MVAALADCVTRRADVREIRPDAVSMDHYRHALGYVLLRGGFTELYPYFDLSRLFSF